MTRDPEIQKIIDYEYTYHFFFNHGLFDELFHFEDLISETSLFLTSKLKSFEDAEEIEIINDRFGKKMQYEAMFPNILWKSIFLSIYFLTEKSLEQICKNLENLNEYNLSIKDIGGNGIYRSSTYLKKVCDISKCFETEIWNNIIDFNKIRNVLAHSDGTFSNDNKAIFNICDKYDELAYYGITEENESGISISKSFTEFALKKTQEFFTLICNEMNEKKASR
ncbi:hypothetical protein GGR42_002427 [Saonia flava]|uniref:RiboL-PSP-HEPN domain-containing protein n=1 Tax=Saonia flava TaxID=523696 RepID=A0A846R210_9FLAO|nr:hypothetical protein [Saonia flava]NJB71965.1 hypothetical protein [Saonia flava]